MLSYEYCISKGTTEEVLAAFWGGPSTLKMLVYKWACCIFLVRNSNSNSAWWCWWDRAAPDREAFRGGLVYWYRRERGQKIFIFPVQLTMTRIGNLTRLIHTLAIRVTIQTYTHDNIL